MKRYTAIILEVLLLVPFSVVHAQVQGGELYLSAQHNVLKVGELVDVIVKADTGVQTVNAIEGELAYNPNDFEIENISTDNSIITSWATQPFYDSAKGFIHFSGWVGVPFQGKEGSLLTITLLPLRVGESSLDFSSGAMLASDGNRGNILTGMKSSLFKTEPRITLALIPVAVAKEPISPEPLPPQVTTTTSVSTTPQLQMPPKPPIESKSNAAAPALSGIQLAPLLIPFFLLLILAFGIAYGAHRFSRSHSGK